MLALLIIINCLAFLFMAFALKTLTPRYRLIFLIGMFTPLVAGILVSLLTEHRILPITDWLAFIGFFFRGWFITCVACGAIGCYILTQADSDNR